MFGEWDWSKYFNSNYDHNKDRQQTWKTYKGRVASYGQIRETLLNTLASATKSINSYVTTMFDFYVLPTDLLGVSDAEKANASNEKVKICCKVLMFCRMDEAH